MSRSLSALSLDLLGTRVRLETNDERWIALLRCLWQPFVVTSSNAENICVIERQATGWKIDVFGDLVVTETDPWRVATFVRNQLVLRAADDATGLIPVHAAVLARGSSALLLVGPSGAGKTTLTVELIAAGWRYGSDDLAPLSIKSGRVVPFPKPLKVVSSGAPARLATLWEPPSWLPPGPVTLLPASVFPLTQHADLAVEYMAFVRFDRSTAATLDPVSSGIALSAVARNVRRIQPEGLRTLAAICQRVPAAKVAFRSPSEGAALIQSMVEGRDRPGV